MIDPVINALIERQKDILESLVLNPANTLEEYRQKVGIWQGIQESLDTIANNKKEDS